MVVFMDLEDDAEPPEQSLHWFKHHGNVGGTRGFGGEGAVEDECRTRENPDREMSITKALGCYP
jgi:hypothetical protein